jgi:hypothetical protein
LKSPEPAEEEPVFTWQTWIDVGIAVAVALAAVLVLAGVVALVM